MPLALQSAFGILVFLVLAWLFSEDRTRIPWRTLLAGIGLQFLLAMLLLWLPPFKLMFMGLNELLLSLEQATLDGTSFVFGYLGGDELPFEETQAGSSFILAFRALPLILLISALSSLLFYWGVLPLIVRGLSRLLQRAMGIGGALALGTATNVFVGMVEAPLLVRPYLKEMTRSELFALMVTGMATIAGTVMVLYASILRDVIPDAMGHILVASLVSAPAAIVIAQLLLPPEQRATAGELVPPERATSNMDAVTRGTLQGVELIINITAMLIVMVALVSLVNMMLGLLPGIADAPLTLQRMLGWLLAPVAWLTGIPWEQAISSGSLLGTKVILNELFAYLDLAAMPAGQLDERSRLIMTYALCGFANFGSLGIMIGGLATMVPERREEIIRLGMKSIAAGTLATCMTGAVMGVLY
ncbi:MAG: nucleoside:proton symporter [Gammaproteobacteria bacterium]|jgi:CNT family concentrative nucleoside transporter|nr:nucleoside:proton symporter [Gammaproteobacteria bacterium]MDH3886867.1 nucleoside:proton symporter [Gammaproteobacteria bacterium]MDH3986464.1 nucleoside:proton symporter [Gammaproteobacteria bacterium]